MKFRKRSGTRLRRSLISFTLAVWLCGFLGVSSATAALKVHGIFSSNMVIQRDKPITIWGWADQGDEVSVQFSDAAAETAAEGEDGRWEVTFPAREASGEPHTLTVKAGDETVEMNNIVIGDIWVMWGQSNMAFPLGKVQSGDLEIRQANLPLLRQVRISPNESYELQKDLPENKVTDWVESSAKTAGGFSAIGYVFASRLQQSLQVPIGIIDNARGGASMESLLPKHKFNDDPMAAEYLKYIEQQRAQFDWDAAVAKLVAKWEENVTKQREKGVPEDKLPAKPTRKNLRSWSIPGTSPSHAASCYNGMFGVFKGLNIKGVLFHQGYNNAMAQGCRPKRYRVLMKLMVEGLREDFTDPKLPVGVVGFCAGSIPQTEKNFETWSVAPGAYIREAQRLGLADLDDAENTAFLPAYDIQIPGLHPHKKRPHGERAARWALNRVYGERVNWDSASLLSAEREGETMVLTFDKDVLPDDMSMVITGFSIAGEDGKFYRAHAWQPLVKDVGIWNTANKSWNNKKVVVWSPLVPEPAGVRYAWARSPMGNLTVNGRKWLPLQSFRTDQWDWPESDDPAESLVDRARSKEMQQDAEQRLEHRRMEEAKRAVEILEKLDRMQSRKPE